MKSFFDSLLKEMERSKASDLHIIGRMQPSLRLNGEILRLDLEPISRQQIDELCQEVLTSWQQDVLQKNGDVDISYTFLNDDGAVCRCRINAFKASNDISFAIRLIPNEIPTLKKLHLPNALETMITQNGLIAVTGPTGSGKTTTLAAMLDSINESRACNIIAIEDPIEYLHAPKKAIIRQREIGNDLPTFSAGLRSALRQDPDVILVGEMRDRETVETALNAAETGHLVLTTLHTGNVIEAVDRILQYFPAEQQTQIQAQLANCFQGVIAQRLLPLRNGGGRIAALEILRRTPATVNLIRSGKSYQLKDYMLPAEGMQTMEAAIKELQQRKLITDMV